MNKQGERVEVIRTYLEMTSPEQFTPGAAEDTDARVERLPQCPASFYRYLYREVGRLYHWVDKLGWTDEEIRARLAAPGVSFWVMYVDGAPAGYVELERHEDGSTEIAYFGLLQEFLGRGLGKRLLNFAIRQAWQEGANRVWLHTCTLDDPAAMPNYLKRGFKPFKQETYFTTISADEQRPRNVTSET
ncbi:MAG TPA: GNAT family N-acetyltransferase [Blastocatellia bacterium]|nr:GNAT family N-acetyltransferase [Blastocatellia bacterium]